MRNFLRRLIDAPPSEQLAMVRARYYVGTGQAFATIVIAGSFLVLMLWDQSNRTGLLVWAAAALLVAPNGIFFKYRPRSHDAWWRWVWLGELAFAIGWGLLPIIAMPADPTWQAIIGTVHVASILVGSVQNSQVRILHLVYVVPYTILTIVGFVMNASGPARMMPLVIIVVLAFSLALSAEQRDLHGKLIESMVNNERLVADLEESQTRLLASNEELAAAARTDPLTKLANRLRFDEVLDARLERSSAPFSLAFLDLDNFKEVNDTMGHRIGDLLLRAVAARMASVAEAGELVARLGGDEFVVLTRRGADPHDVAKRFASVFADPFTFDDKSVIVRASVGIATAKDTSSSDELLRRADNAQYAAKHRGGGCVAIGTDVVSAPAVYRPLILES